MKRMLLAAGIALLASLAGCSTFSATTQLPTQQSVTAALAKLQTTIVDGCTVVQPTLQSVAGLDPRVAVAATANGLFCATASTITVTSVQSLLSTGIPAIEQAVNASTLIPADQKPLVTAALGLFQLTAKNALAVYEHASAAAAASGASAASAPASASAPVAASSPQ